MKTKLQKFETTRENARLLIQPRQRDTAERRYVDANSCDVSPDSVETVNTEPLRCVPSNSSIVEVPCAIRNKRMDENLSDRFRALLRISDSYYELDISEHIEGFPPDEFEMAEETNDAKTMDNSKLLDTPNRSTLKKKRNAPSICLAGSRYSIISRVAKSLGWKVVRDTDLWNIYWTDSVQGVDMFKDMKRFQRVNHFPGMVEICRKDLLARNLTRMLRLFPGDYNFFPKTWCFPADFGDAFNYSRQYKNRTFILKPDTGAQGRGIWLTKNLKEVKPNERMICQVYINKPLLIDGYKFDLRVYSLITSVDPLRVYVYNEGLARFATSKYQEPSGNNTSNIFMHLTNYSVNKHSRSFSKDDEAGSKRKFSTLNRILMTEGYDVEKLWSNVDDIVVKTILSSWPVLKHNYHACFPCHDVVPGCFEILGFDILVDSRMRAFLLEVNHSPSFHTDEAIDRDVKEALLRDSFQILNTISLTDKRKILKEDKRRVQWRLLQRIRESGKPELDTVEMNNSSASTPPKVTSISNSQQIAWEESNVGNFRRVMPAPNNPNKYTGFLILQNQASIYSDTAASKRREEAAKRLRSEIVQKALNDQKFLMPAMKKTNEAMANYTKSSENSNEQKRKKRPLNKRMSIMACMINEIEERERVMQLSRRDFLVRSSGLEEMIFENFYHNKLLSDSDRIKLKELYEKLEAESLSQSFDMPNKTTENTQETCSSSTTFKKMPSNCRLPSVTTDERRPTNQSESTLGQYIASGPVGNSDNFILERVQRVRGKNSELCRKIMPK